jgi:hypothetical protein
MLNTGREDFDNHKRRQRQLLHGRIFTRGHLTGMQRKFGILALWTAPAKRRGDGALASPSDPIAR